MIDIQSNKLMIDRPVDILHTRSGNDELVLNHSHEKINKHK